MVTSFPFYDLSSLYGYPADLTMIRDWITQYQTLKASSQAAAESLSAQTEDFEMVPIPKKLLAGVSGLGPGLDAFMGASGIMKVPATGAEFDELSGTTEAERELRKKTVAAEKAREYPGVVALGREFCQALEAGDVKRLKLIMDDEYRDFDGRDRNEVCESLAKLIDATDQRRVVPVHIETMDVLGNTVAVAVVGAWEAKLDGQEDLSSEFFKLEVVIRRGEKGLRITSLKHES